MVWANTQLENILGKSPQMVETCRDAYGRILGWFPVDYVESERPIGIYIYIESPKVYTREGGQQIEYYPIRNLVEKDKEGIAQIDVPEEEEIPTPTENMQEVYNVPQAKDTTKALEMEAGEYSCRKFACTTYHGKERTILYLLPIGKDRDPTTDKEYLYMVSSCKKK